MKKLLLFLCVYIIPLAVWSANLSDLQFGEINWGEPYGIRYGVTQCSQDAEGELILPAEHEGRAVTLIDDKAFKGCTNLTAITLSEGIEAIGINSFSDCTLLEEVHLPTTLIHIWSKAFTSCSSLHQVILPSGLLLDEMNSWNCHSIFANCTSLTNVVVPQMKAVPETFLLNCSSLSSIELPPTIETIRLSAFEGTSLATIDFPDALTFIGDDAFKDTPLDTIQLPSGLEHIGRDAFAGTHIGYQPIAPNLRIISEFLYADSDMTEFLIPSTVERINKGAFSGCTSLAHCDYSQATNLVQIDEQAFYNCASLLSADLSNCTSLTSIGAEAFALCSGLESITFPDSLTSIGNGLLRSTFSYHNGPSIREIYLPPGITKIPDHAFLGCHNLADFSSGSSLTHIGVYAFAYNVELKTIPLQEVTYIGSGAFSSCWSLENVEFSPHLTYIGDDAFHSCASLTAVHLPDHLTEIGRYTFCNCSSLQSLTLPDQLEIIRYAAFGGSKIEELKIPDNVRAIESLAFAKTPNLKRLILPDHLTSIHEACFRDCTSLQFVQFPATLNWLSRFCFKNCTQLQRTFFQGAAPESWTGYDPFDENASLTHHVFGAHYNSFIEAGYSNVVIVDDPFMQEDDHPERELSWLIKTADEPLLARLKHSNHWTYTMECTYSLMNPDWRPLALTPHLEDETDVQTFILPTDNSSNCFYRAVAYPTFLQSETNAE